jgi:hypothetical protein
MVSRTSYGPELPPTTPIIDHKSEDESTYFSDDEMMEQRSPYLEVVGGDSFLTPKPQCPAQEPVSYHQQSHNDKHTNADSPVNHDASFAASSSIPSGHAWLTNEASSAPKSPGRSPILRQSASVTIPAALRRISVYSNLPPIPALSNPVVPKSETNEQLVEHVPDGLVHADSDLSIYSTASARWGDEESNFTSGAQAMFNNLGSRSSEVDSTFGIKLSDAVAPRLFSSETSSTVASHLENSTSLEYLPTTKTSPASSLVEIDNQSSERQRLIEELVQTEVEYYECLVGISQTYIQPLRTQGTRAWIGGVPPNISRLFDWLEDIMNLHALIATALRQMVDREYTSTQRVGSILREFVADLEVYQPYVVRVSAVAEIIDELTRCPGSSFGEFICIKKAEGALGGRTLRDLLVIPTKRLKAYPELFQVSEEPKTAGVTHR